MHSKRCDQNGTKLHAGSPELILSCSFMCKVYERSSESILSGGGSLILMVCVSEKLFFIASVTLLRRAGDCGYSLNDSVNNTPGFEVLSRRDFSFALSVEWLRVCSPEGWLIP